MLATEWQIVIRLARSGRFGLAARAEVDAAFALGDAVGLGYPGSPAGLGQRFGLAEQMDDHAGAATLAWAAGSAVGQRLPWWFGGGLGEHAMRLVHQGEQVGDLADRGGGVHAAQETDFAAV